MTDETLKDDASKASRDSASTSPSPLPTPKTPDYALLARLVIREGKQFYASALTAGYSESVARRGMRACMEDSKPMTEAVKRESESFPIKVDSLRPMALKRLYFELLDPMSSNGMKAVELTGRLKELDMFVRNSETNIGILIGMHDTPSTPDDAIDITQE